MKNMKNTLLALGLGLALATPAQAVAQEKDDKDADINKVEPTQRAAAPKIQIPLPSGDKDFLRLITWHQFWARGIQNNPGTTVQGMDRDATTDIGIRRSRILALGQFANGRVQILSHFGINNQTFNNTRKPQLYIHDAWGSFQVLEKYLTLGAGLHYWNGVSRLTNASTLNFLPVDAPILNWTTIERTDQFARQAGLFAKGQIGRVDYRLALNKPFSTSRELTPGGAADYLSESDSLSTAGYVQLFMREKESNTLPYAVGTYLGKKDVFNVGAGFHYHPDALGTRNAADTETTQHDLVAIGVDAFLDKPLGKGSALTSYLVYYYYDFGPNHVRNIGIMNVGQGGTSVNGSGNAYPVMGTGNHVYGQLGYLLPGEPLGLQIQPDGTFQVSLMEALDDPMVVGEGGINWFVLGHHAKVTTHYRNRPVFEVPGNGDRPTADSRASEVIVQFAFFL